MALGVNDSGQVTGVGYNGTADQAFIGFFGKHGDPQSLRLDYRDRPGGE